MRYVMVFTVMMLLIAGMWGSVLAQTDEELMLANLVASNEAFNAHDVDGVLATRTDDVIVDYVPSPPPMVGKEATVEFYTTLLEEPSDILLTPQNALTSGNILATEYLITGTHMKEWAGIPASWNKVVLPHLSIYEYEGDKVKKVKKEFSYMDNVTLFVQYGVMPPVELPSLVPSFTPPDPEPTGLSPAEAAEELIARFNTHDLSHFIKMVQQDAEIQFMPLGVPVDRNGFLALAEYFLLGFSDLAGDIVRAIDMGDGWVVTQDVYAGTHDGPYMGVPATGLPSQTRAAGVMHFDADGLLTDYHLYYDSLKALMDIGAIPTPETTTVSPSTWGEIKSKYR